MIQVPPNAYVVVMHEPISFHNGIDGTAAIARLVLEKEPMDGAFFVFRNRQRNMLRVLFYDGSGFWLCTKRLSWSACTQDIGRSSAGTDRGGRLPDCVGRRALLRPRMALLPHPRWRSRTPFERLASR